MARQYIPFNQKIRNIPLIIYPVKDENPLQNIFDNKNDIENHLKILYKQNDVLKKGNYHIVFIWNLENKRMTDVWIHSTNEWSDSGPLLECYTFRGLKPCNDAAIASGDSILILAGEEELRRKSKNQDEYLNREKILPKFSKDMVPNESFN